MHICLIGHSRESFREDLMIGDMAHKYRNRNKEFTMANHLVIVESPAKVKTIKKFLGSNYEVDASGGHEIGRAHV